MTRRLTTEEMQLYLAMEVARNQDDDARRVARLFERAGNVCSVHQAAAIWKRVSAGTGWRPLPDRDGALWALLDPHVPDLYLPPDDPAECRAAAASWARLSALVASTLRRPEVRDSLVAHAFLSLGRQVGETEAESLVRAVPELCRILTRLNEQLYKVEQTRVVVLTVPTDWLPPVPMPVEVTTPETT